MAYGAPPQLPLTAVISIGKIVVWPSAEKFGVAALATGDGGLFNCTASSNGPDGVGGRLGIGIGVETIPLPPPPPPHALNEMAREIGADQRGNDLFMTNPCSLRPCRSLTLSITGTKASMTDPRCRWQKADLFLIS